MAPSRPSRAAATRSAKVAKDPKEQLKRRGADLIRKVADRDRYCFFLEPVDADGYATVITRPMDLSTLQNNLSMGVYRTPMELRTDFDLIWSNCCTFNADDSIYFREAVRLRAVAARFYDEFVRNLSRDGVAVHLGVPAADHSAATPPSSTPTAAPAASASARVSAKRPPRHRGTPSATPSAHPPTNPPTHPPTHLPTHPQQPETPTTTDPQARLHAPANQTYPPTPAPSTAAQTPQNSINHAQLRRAKANYEAALAAVKNAEAELETTAKNAGLPTPSTRENTHNPEAQLPEAQLQELDTAQIFNGPSGILRKRKDGRDIQQHPSKYAILNNPAMRDRCASVPATWRRIGRWHPPGTTHTPFLSDERARDVQYGRQFTRYVERSAPLARRLLATILHPETVQEHDKRIIAAATDASAPLAGKPTPAEGVRENGAMEAECEIQPRRVPPLDSAGSRKRPRSKANLGAAQPNGTCAEFDEKSVTGKLLLEVLGEESLREVMSKEKMPAVSLSQPSKNAISKMRSLLKSKGIDTNFVTGLMVDEPAVKKARVDALDETCTDDGKKSSDEKLNDLLHANYQGMMNTLRLRAVVDSVNEAEREEVEDRERECAEHVAKGIALAVSKLPPRFVVHPLDAAECARDLCNAIESTHPNLQATGNLQTRTPTQQVGLPIAKQPSAEAIELLPKAPPLKPQPPTQHGTKPQPPKQKQTALPKPTKEASTNQKTQATKPQTQVGPKQPAMKKPVLKVAATPIAKTPTAKTPVKPLTKPPVKPKAPQRKRQRRRPPAKEK